MIGWKSGSLRSSSQKANRMFSAENNVRVKKSVSFVFIKPPNLCF